MKICSLILQRAEEMRKGVETSADHDADAVHDISETGLVIFL